VILHRARRGRPRYSGLYATGFIGYFCIIPIVVFGAAALVTRKVLSCIDAGRHALPELYRRRGLRTILAVMADLTQRPSAMTICVNVIKKGLVTEKKRVKVAKIAPVIFDACAVLLPLLFKSHNVAYGLHR
jgi:Na+(H+)/acetate symporter ActP